MQSNVLLNNSCNNLVYALSDKLCEINEKPIILCLGTDKVIADSLGPLVGYFLTEKYHIKAYIYGSLKRTVNASNLPQYYAHINKTHKGRKLLVVDAKIGDFNEFGDILVNSGGIIPYKNTFLKPIGDINITGVVLPQKSISQCLLHQTKLQFIYEMAEKIAKIIYHAYSFVY